MCPNYVSPNERFHENLIGTGKNNVISEMSQEVQRSAYVLNKTTENHYSKHLGAFCMYATTHM